MRNLLALLFTVSVVVSAWAQKPSDNLVLVQGGTFKNTKSNYYGKSTVPNQYIGKMVAVSDFYIGKYEVTQKEWIEVMGSNPSKFQGDNLPVEMVSWYDCVEYCNKRSINEGLKPYYSIEKDKPDPNNRTDIDNIKWTVTINDDANGYRLPEEAEWEYAASGGQASRSYTYSGGDNIDKAAWYWQNSGDKKLTGMWSWSIVEQNHNKTKPIGGKEPNELGLYDMSGNVREWCWDWYGDLDDRGAAPKGSSSESGRVWRGGGWLGGDFCCASSFRAGFEASGKGPDQGLRVCRSK